MTLRIDVVANESLDAELEGQVLALCSDAYDEDFSEFLELLGDATHVLAFEGDELVSHAAWLGRELRLGRERRPLSCAYVEAVATAKPWQRRGLGTRVLQAIPPLIQHFDIAALSPSESHFYASSGWQMWRGPLYCARDGRRWSTPGEEVMILRLPRTPSDLGLDDELEADWRPGDIW